MENINNEEFAGRYKKIWELKIKNRREF
jgi:hypothetical protein